MLRFSGLGVRRPELELNLDLDTGIVADADADTAPGTLGSSWCPGDPFLTPHLVGLAVAGLVWETVVYDI